MSNAIFRGNTVATLKTGGGTDAMNVDASGASKSWSIGPAYGYGMEILNLRFVLGVDAALDPSVFPGAGVLLTEDKGITVIADMDGTEYDVLSLAGTVSYAVTTLGNEIRSLGDLLVFSSLAAPIVHSADAGSVVVVDIPFVTPNDVKNSGLILGTYDLTGDEESPTHEPDFFHVKHESDLTGLSFMKASVWFRSLKGLAS